MSAHARRPTSGFLKLQVLSLYFQGRDQAIGYAKIRARWAVTAEDKPTAFLELELAIHACGESPRQASGIFPTLAGYENKHSTNSNYIFTCLLCAVQNAQAVSPVPDGGYPGGNTAEGQNALLSLTSGTWS
jgi:hypothetical protein